MRVIFVFLLCLLLILPILLFADVGIEFTFANGEITTSEDTTFYEFDVMAAASEVGTKIGTGIALINYNTAGFGASIYTNGKVTVTKGTLTTTQGPPLYILIVNDNQTYRLAITFEYTSVSGWGNDLPDTATQLVHVKIEIADQTETAGLSFEESLMSDQQYYDDNTTKYNPVIATDIDNSTLPVELAAFTATYVTEYDYISICWLTASETDVIGFNIYRNTDDAFETAIKINVALIPGHGTTSELQEYNFIDDNPVELDMTYYYWLESVELGGEISVYSSISITPEDGSGGYIDAFTENTLVNYPNPFSTLTTIKYAIKGRLITEPVEIRIYNISGQLLQTIEANNGIALWDAGNLPTSIYFYQLKTLSYTEIKKMTLIR